MERYLVYDPSDSAEPRFFKTLEEGYLHMNRIIDNYRLSDGEWVKWVEGLVLARIVYKTKKIEYIIPESERKLGEPTSAYDYRMEKV